MTRKTETVWQDSKGETLLRKTELSKYYTPLGTMDIPTMRELRDALIDALKDTPPEPQPEVTEGE